MAADDAAIDPDRFELIDHLGEGHHGVVHRVRDHARGEVVALKTLTLRGARDVYRFKREFRSLAALVHPNLVRLYELFSVGEEWMFTMELIDGVPLTAWVRPGGRDGAVDVDRLRDALRQLVDGLAALHAAGKLHRDLKPTNVLVEPSGRVVILDFGLVADVATVDRTHERMAVGTPAYMSPEQAADRPLTAAADRYAVGAMLYEALTGRRPFEGSAAELLIAKQVEEPVPPRQRCPDVPADLDALCVALLARDPAARPDDDATLAALGTRASPWTRRVADAVTPELTGLAPTLAALEAALDDSRDHTVTVVVAGPLGAGKTTVVQEFLAHARGRGAVVLESRADPREQVPFRAADQLADDLSIYLVGLPEAERAPLIPPDAAVAARLFAALRRVPGFDAPLLPGMASGDAATLAVRAFGVVRVVLERIAARRPLVIAFDDAHWATPDGPRMMTRYFVGPGAPRMLTVVTVDSAALPGTSLGHELPSWTGDVRRLDLPARRARR
ncbi:MAG: serine/threonine-protein kinase PknK [Kofleriaceae bacterium]|nr:serine/threonine-protein kinase PknK [Myxococcales bacterium]MCB9560431.1 serine/threonine-protein kinase PknK [Kofleriaceae bacterium]